MEKGRLNERHEFIKNLKKTVATKKKVIFFKKGNKLQEEHIFKKLMINI